MHIYGAQMNYGLYTQGYSISNIDSIKSHNVNFLREVRVEREHALRKSSESFRSSSSIRLDEQKVGLSSLLHGFSLILTEQRLVMGTRRSEKHTRWATPRRKCSLQYLPRETYLCWQLADRDRPFFMLSHAVALGCHICILFLLQMHSLHLLY